MHIEHCSALLRKGKVGEKKAQLHFQFDFLIGECAQLSETWKHVAQCLQARTLLKHTYKNTASLILPFRRGHGAN